MKLPSFAAITLVSALSVASFAAEGWQVDFEKAKEQALAEKKVILMDFTGSDWCGWCIKLDKEVFSKKEFKDYAKENLILVTLDFPHEARQSKKLKEQNEALSKKYNVEGFPTIILVDAEGKKLGETGYQEGGPAKYVEHLKELLAKAKK